MAGRPPQPIMAINSVLIEKNSVCVLFFPPFLYLYKLIQFSSLFFICQHIFPHSMLKIKSYNFFEESRIILKKNIIFSQFDQNFIQHHISQHHFLLASEWLSTVSSLINQLCQFFGLVFLNFFSQIYVHILGLKVHTDIPYW